ncbi:MAG: hypothetical protein H7831_03780 [Magnetococcus sp. WYHC-3]
MTDYIPYHKNGNWIDDAGPLADHVDVLRLSAGASVDYVVPAGRGLLCLKFTDEVYVRQGGMAQVPDATRTDGGGSALAPCRMAVRGGEVIGFAAPNLCTVTISCYV